MPQSSSNSLVMYITVNDCLPVKGELKKIVEEFTENSDWYSVIEELFYLTDSLKSID